jgi:hypothetical protein
MLVYYLLFARKKKKLLEIIGKIKVICRGLEGKVDLSKRPYAKKMKVTHTEQVENRGVDKLPRSKSAGL